MLAPGEAGCDPVPWLKVRKQRKFMGLQDELAVVAAGRALEQAGADGSVPPERTGIYLAVGYIPFEVRDMEGLLVGAVAEGRFSMAGFAEGGYREINPLLTFRCLSNMPAYHLSFNFDVQGPYFVTYPGPAQFYAALEEAVAALRAGRIDRALVGGVAHQRNFLVEHHHRRLDPPVPPDRLRDSAAILVLETEARARARGATVRARLVACEAVYDPPDPLEDERAPSERFWTTSGRVLGPHGGSLESSGGALGSSDGTPGSSDGALVSSDGTLGSSDGTPGSSCGALGSSDGALGSSDGTPGSSDKKLHSSTTMLHSSNGVHVSPGGALDLPGELGAASLPVWVCVALGRAGRWEHELASRDGVRARSTWEVP